MSVQRYNFYVGLYTCKMTKNTEGEWVKFDDVKRAREADAHVMFDYMKIIDQKEDKIKELTAKLQRREILIADLEKALASLGGDE